MIDGNNHPTLGASTDADTLDGRGGNDALFGRGGAESPTGGGGDDNVDGGDGTDTAKFSGTWANYTITNGITHIDLQDRRGGAPDGFDVTTNIENFQFSNGTFSVATLLNVTPTDIGLAGTSVNETAANGTVVGSLSGTDADTTRGDVLAFSLLDNAGGRFAISGTNLVVANGSLLDFETNTSHAVTVRVTDLSGATRDESFLIAVNFVAPATPPAGVVINDDNVGHTLTGTEQNDIIRGNGGNDVIIALGGSDIVNGNAGRDGLEGGAGADTFKWFNIHETGLTNATRDNLRDFQHGVDKIDLRALTPRLRLQAIKRLASSGRRRSPASQVSCTFAKSEARPSSRVTTEMAPPTFRSRPPRPGTSSRWPTSFSEVRDGAVSLPSPLRHSPLRWAFARRGCGELRDTAPREFGLRRRTRPFGAPTSDAGDRQRQKKLFCI